VLGYSLPSQPTPFVGREQELAEIATLLATPACRLLTLTGPGGIGKTRLAIEASARAGDFKDGVYFVSLHALPSSDRIVPTLAETLAFTLYGEQFLKLQLLNYLSMKNLLLVLDSFDHLLDGAPLLPDILTTAAGVKIMVTSRERLHLQEEWVLDVGGLLYPPSEAEESLERYSAIQLFLLSARRAHAAFKPGDAEWPAIVRICQRVEGIPLGIELSAAWVRTLPCRAIADELERSPDILTTTLRNLPEQHQSMRAVFDYSWNRLDDDEQTVFRKLPVFQGSFTRQAAEQVAGASLPVLASLVDKSMLRVDTQGRYLQHEVLRQYVEDRLNRSGEADAARDAHCAYYTAWLHRLAADLKGPNQAQALAQIESEIANVRAAWRWAVARGKEREILQSLDSLAIFYQIRSRFHEAEEAFGQAASRLEPTDGEALAHAILLQDWYCHFDADPLKRRYRVVRGVSILRRVGFQRAVGMIFEMLCFRAEALGGDEAVYQLLEDSLAAFRQSQDGWRTAWALHGLGLAAYRTGQFEQAEQLQRDSLAAFRAIGDRWGATWALNTLGEWAQSQGRYDDARRCFEETRAVCRELGDPGGIAWSLGRLGIIADALREYDSARQYLAEILTTKLEAGSAWLISDHEIYLMARALEAEGQAERAVEMLAFFLSHADISLPLHRLQDKAVECLNSLKSSLPPEVFDAAMQRGQASDLETVALSILKPLSGAGQAVAASQPLREPLTERELEILRLLADGYSNRETADQLVLAVSTVKWYTNQIFSKLNVHSRTQAIARARELKLLA
jgi:predicted ATPase/DNA-binding CsgD family transcriptional regulator